MQIDPTPDQEALVRQGIEAGRYRTREDAIRDALARWEEEERDRAEPIAALDEAEREIDEGLLRSCASSRKISAMGACERGSPARSMTADRPVVR